MSNLIAQIDRVKDFLADSLNQLEMINEDNFESNFSKARSSMESALNLRVELIKKYGAGRLKKFNPELADFTKQIEKSFDNIVAHKVKEQKEVALQLEQASNLKKLANYGR